MRLNLAANSGPARSGVVRIAFADGFQDRTISQAAPCTYGVTPLTQNVAAAGGTFAVTVDTTDGCTWSASVPPSSSFITIASGGGPRTGDGNVTFSVAANAGATSLAGTTLVAGQTVTVAQAAPCTYSVSPLTHSLGASAGTFTVDVTTASGCEWSASVQSSPFITIATGGGPRTGNGSVTFSVAANSGSSVGPRPGSVQVAATTVNVTQAAPCTYSVSPLNYIDSTAEGGTATVGVTTASGCEWSSTVSPSSSFIAITSGGGPRTGNGSVVFQVAANSSFEPRAATVRISWIGGMKDVPVYQEGRILGFYGFLLSTGAVPFGGAPYCRYTEEYKSINVHIYLANSFQGVIHKTLRAAQYTLTAGSIETALDGCPFAPIPPNRHDFRAVAGHVSNNSTIHIDFEQLSGAPEVSLVFDGTLSGNQIAGVFTFRRMNAPPILLWTIQAKMTLTQVQPEQ